MLEFLFASDKVIIGTLGPVGTSSYNALQYLTEQLTNFKRNIVFENKLYDNFDEVLIAIISKDMDFALIPSAYRDITKYFWNPTLKNAFTFIYPTPKYGIVSKTDYVYIENSPVRIAVCEPVECLIDTMWSKENVGKSFVKIITPSTTKALEAVIEGNADLAITNETSFAKYSSTHEIKFISDCFDSQMVWCLFQNVHA